MASIEHLTALVKAKLGATHVDIVDVSGGCGAKFEAVIVSDQFEGKKLLQRHRLVNETLASEMAKIHAFSQKTYTPQEWEQKKTEAAAAAGQ